MINLQDRLGQLSSAAVNSPAMREALAIYGLYVLGVLKPLIDMLTASPDFFTLHNVTSLGVLATCGALLAAPAVVLLPWRRLLKLGKTDTARLLLATVGGILAALTLAVMIRQSNLPLPAVLTAMVAMLAAAGAAWSFWRKPRAIEFLAIAGVLASLHLMWSMVRLVPPIWKAPLAAALSPDHADKKPTDNVLVLVFDELTTPMLMRGDGELHRQRFPGFARLQDMSTWFTEAKSVGCYTQIAVPAILTGVYPIPSRATPTVLNYPNNLFTMLSRSHAADSWEPITQLCPSEICKARTRFRLLGYVHHLAVAYAHAVVPKSWSSRLPDLQSLWIRAFQLKQQDHAVAGDRRSQAHDFLGALDKLPRETPWLKFAHFTLPHAPFEFLGTGQSYFFGERYLFGADAPALTAMLWGRDADHVGQNHYRHLLQTQYVDWIVGETLRLLELNGELDRTMIVVTADHGVDYRTGEYHRETTTTNYVFQASVPLFIKAPGQKSGGASRAPALSVDIVPTILARLGLRSPVLDGRDLLQPAAAAPATTFKHACIDVAKGSAASAYRDYPADTRAAVLAEAKRTADLFGSEATPRLRFSRYGAWIGRVPSEVATIAPASDGKVLYSPRLQNWNEVDVGASWLPLHIDGRFVPGRTADAGPHVLAVAINNRIAAVMPTIRIGNEHVMTMMVEASSLAKGSNKLEFYRVVTQGDAHALQPVPFEYR